MKKAFTAALVLVLVITLMAGCGTRQNSSASSYGESTPSESGFNAGAQSDQALPEEEKEASAPESADVTSADNQKITYSGSVVIETTDYDAAVSDIKALISGYDCLVGASDEYNDDQSWRDDTVDSSARTCSWTILVPSERFSDMMDSIGTIHGHVRSKRQDSDNLTRQYHDTESRIAALKVQEQRLLSFMEEADNVSDLLEIEDRLSEVRYELETLQNQNNSIDFQVQYATLQISLEEVADYDSTGLSFGQRVSHAFSDSGSSFTHAVQGLIILLILLLPYLVIAGVVVLVLFATRNRRARRRMERRQKNAAAQKGPKGPDVESPD